MSSRTWQMLAAAVSVALMVLVIVKYGLGDGDAAKPKSSQPHVGTEHHTNEVPGAVGKPAHVGGKSSPIQVYEHAKVGDWRAYRVITESSIAPAITATAITRITEVDDKRIIRSFGGRVESTGQVRQNGDQDRPRAGLTIDQLTSNDVGGWTIYDLVITDEDHTVGSRTFECKKLTYLSKDPMIANKRTRTELWISAEVPVGGIVELREVQEMPSMKFVITQQLIGFGDAKGTTWGTKPDGI